MKSRAGPWSGVFPGDSAGSIVRSMFQIASHEEPEELHAAGAELIYNDFSGQGAGGAQYNVLPHADCRWVARIASRRVT
jgi:hypothetical protein